jgi:hypothetical protein
MNQALPPCELGNVPACNQPLADATKPCGNPLKLGNRHILGHLFNKFNVADFNVLWTSAGQPTAASDPRNSNFGLKLRF